MSEIKVSAYRAMLLLEVPCLLACSCITPVFASFFTSLRFPSSFTGRSHVPMCACAPSLLIRDQSLALGIALTQYDLILAKYFYFYVRSHPEVSDGHELEGTLQHLGCNLKVLC